MSFVKAGNYCLCRQCIGGEKKEEPYICSVCGGNAGFFPDETLEEIYCEKCVAENSGQIYPHRAGKEEIT